MKRAFKLILVVYCQITWGFLGYFFWKSPSVPRPFLYPPNVIVGDLYFWYYIINCLLIFVVPIFCTFRLPNKLRLMSVFFLLCGILHFWLANQFHSDLKVFSQLYWLVPVLIYACRVIDRLQWFFFFTFFIWVVAEQNLPILDFYFPTFL
jgi:hypothetical protein